MSSMIQVQDALIAKLNASARRWDVSSHIRFDHCDCGHYGRSRRGAINAAKKSLKSLGFDEDQAIVVIRDAIDVAQLQLIAE